jgi:hypothetical protein
MDKVQKHNSFRGGGWLISFSSREKSPRDPMVSRLVDPRAIPDVVGKRSTPPEIELRSLSPQQFLLLTPKSHSL